MSNNPSNVVTVTAEEDFCIRGNDETVCVSEGEEVSISKAHNYWCADRVEVKDEDPCEDTHWMVTIPANGAYKAEVPVAKGVPLTLCVESCECLAYVYGTEDSPLNPPADLVEIKGDAPDLLQAGSHELSLSDESGNAINAFALYNTSANDVVVELIFKGCK